MKQIFIRKNASRIIFIFIGILSFSFYNQNALALGACIGFNKTGSCTFDSSFDVQGGGTFSPSINITTSWDNVVNEADTYWRIVVRDAGDVAQGWSSCFSSTDWLMGVTKTISLNPNTDYSNTIAVVGDANLTDCENAVGGGAYITLINTTSFFTNSGIAPTPTGMGGSFNPNDIVAGIGTQLSTPMSSKLPIILEASAGLLVLGFFWRLAKNKITGKKI